MIALIFIKITNLNSGRSDQKQARRNFIKMDEKIRNTAYNSCIAYNIKFWGWVFVIFRFSRPTIIWPTCFEFGIWNLNGLQFAFWRGKFKMNGPKKVDDLEQIRMSFSSKWMIGENECSCEPGTLNLIRLKLVSTEARCVFCIDDQDFSWHFILRYNLYGEYD